MVGHDRDVGYGGTGFIVAWTVLIMLGMAVEFLGRFFGYTDNPLAMYHPLIPAFTGILAAFIILAGYFTLISRQAKQRAMTRRTGVLLITLGISMLIGFFIFKQIIPLIFG
jgi:hypothetical protein